MKFNAALFSVIKFKYIFFWPIHKWITKRLNKIGKITAGVWRLANGNNTTIFILLRPSVNCQRFVRRFKSSELPVLKKFRSSNICAPLGTRTVHQTKIWPMCQLTWIRNYKNKICSFTHRPCKIRRNCKTKFLVNFRSACNVSWLKNAFA